MLIQALQRAEIYDHAVERFEVIETHISWVLLTGAYAYKIKKPVDLGFVDFSTLEKRRFYYYEELRLNRRLAPQLYLAVMPITGTSEAPRLGGTGEAIEYALKMAQFPQQAQLDRVLARGELQPSHIDGLAELIAAFHGSIPVAGQDLPFGLPERLVQPMRENFEQLLPLVQDSSHRLGPLRGWTEAAYQKLYEALTARKGNGFVRECHGDMHLGNMAFFRGEIVIFDGIDFNENLRWIDVMSELAFLAMDLEERGHPMLAWRLVNAYLTHTGDYAGLAVLRFYQVYRAMVRAKVTCIRLHQGHFAEGEADRLMEQYLGYLGLAESYTRPPSTAILITRGLSGSGKTTLTQTLLERWGAIRIRSDIERKRLFGLTPTASSGSGLGAGLYAAEGTERTYRRLAELASTIITVGHPVIVDAASLKRAQREMFRELAEKHGVPFAILDFRAPEPVLRERIGQRQRWGGDASEADLAVLEHQLVTQEPLTPDEQALAIPVDAEGTPELDQVLAALQARFS
jgi:aminoglycoside phosphotransferase family enzyme/gluconate kinase